MRSLIRPLVLGLLAVGPLAYAQQPGDVIPDEYVVTVASGVDASGLAARHGLAPRHVYGSVLNGFAGFVPPGRLRALAADPRVISISPDRVVSIGAKPGGGSGGTGKEVLPVGVVRVGAPGAWAGGFRGDGVGVAILDTGIDLGNADLNVVDGVSAFGGSAMDDHGHGTHVAGTVAALDNTSGVVGVAPEATLYAVKVLNAQGSGSDSSVIAGLNWVAENADAIKVANMSLGRPAGGHDDMHVAIQNLVAAGVTVVVSAGNDCGLETTDLVPSGFPEVISVASTTAQDGTSPYTTKILKDSASYFTTDGPDVTVSAPGEDAENILRGGRIQSVGILSLKLGGGTTRMSGTSMAAPHVTGVVALVCEKYPGISPAQVSSRIVATAQFSNVAPLDGLTSCYSFDGTREGVVDAVAALE